MSWEPSSAWIAAWSGNRFSRGIDALRARFCQVPDLIKDQSVGVLVQDQAPLSLTLPARITTRWFLQWACGEVLKESRHEKKARGASSQAETSAGRSATRRSAEAGTVAVAQC